MTKMRKASAVVFGALFALTSFGAQACNLAPSSFSSVSGYQDEWLNGAPYIRHPVASVPNWLMQPPPVFQPEQEALLTIFMCIMIPGCASASLDEPSRALAGQADEQRPAYFTQDLTLASWKNALWWLIL